jgi:competence protein ComEA
MWTIVAPVLIVSSFLGFPAKAQQLPDGPGKAELEKVCGTCHGVDMFVGMKEDRATWKSTVRKMVSRGADGTDQELDAIINYLATYLGKDDDQKPDKVNVNKASAPEIEKGLQLTTQEAEAIVQYRTKNGDYKDWHDLEKVGVDAKKIEAVKERIGL